MFRRRAEPRPQEPRTSSDRGVLFRAALGWLTLLVVVAVLAPMWPTDPGRGHLLRRLEGPGWRHPFGFDGNGRDILARVLHGTRVSLIVGVVSVTIGMSIGGVLGLIAGYFRRRVDTLIVTVLDSMLAFPALVLAVAVTSIRGQSVTTVTAVIGVLMVPLFARIARAGTLGAVEREYVTAARCLGAGSGRIVRQEILPNVIGPLIVFALLAFGIVIIIEGALSFLGVGVPVDTISWGGIIAGGQGRLRDAPHVSLFPAAVLSITILAVNYVGDRLRGGGSLRIGGR